MIFTASENFYFKRDEEGVLCAFDSNTHICIDVIESTGDIPLSAEKRKSYIGRLDPKYGKN